VPGLTALIPTGELSLYALGGPAPACAGPRPLPFSSTRYSRYKYGSVTATQAFARELAADLSERHPDLARAPGLVMTSSPYACVPTAATTLARSLQPLVNAARAAHGLRPVPLVKVDRISPSAGDYGTLSAQARDRHMAANALSFQALRPGQASGAHLLVVDDLRVTGAHQRCLMHASEDLPLAARTFLYIAAFPGSASAGFDPTQEDALNHAAVRTLDDLAGIVEAGDFAWNVRACKFLLNQANRDDLARFLRRMPGWFVAGLYRNSLGDGYWRMTPYAASHAITCAELGRRRGAPPAARRPA
jgi:PRTase ComF-like